MGNETGRTHNVIRDEKDRVFSLYKVFFYVFSYSIRLHAFISGPILFIDLSISSHYYAQSNEGLIKNILLLCAYLQADTYFL